MRRSAFPILCLPRAPPAGQHASARNRVAFAAPHPQARPVSHIGEGEALIGAWDALGLTMAGHAEALTWRLGDESSRS